MTVDAQLISPSEPVCPGNRVIFTCQLPGSLIRWTITLSSSTIDNSVQSPQNGPGSILRFPEDPGFNFEIHVISSGSDGITTELQVTAVRELNGVMVECAGLTTRFTSTISIASISEFRIIISYIDCLSVKNLKIPQLLQVESWQPISSSQKLESQ